MALIQDDFPTILSTEEISEKYTLVLLDLEKSMTTSIIQKEHCAKREIDFFGCLIYDTKCDGGNSGTQVILDHT